MDMSYSVTLGGHSERREHFGESSELVGEKTKFCLDNGVKVIAATAASVDRKVYRLRERLCLILVIVFLSSVNCLLLMYW
eukprot:m.145809 g.145809  ORF g.145809 m.145809 type:complete len:80 (-) comp14958_c0_seq2:2482-2721(-)